MDARLTATISTKGAAKASSELNKFSSSAKSAESNVVKFEKSSKSASAGIGAIGRSSGQAGIQVQQFIGQIQGGQSAMVALSQQSADLGFVLGAPLVGAVVGITASLVGMAFALGDTEVAMVDNDDAIRTLIGSYDDLTLSQQALTKKLLASKIKEQELAIKSLTDQQRDYETSLNIGTSLTERSKKVNQFTSNIIANELALSKNKEKLDDLNGIGIVYNEVNAEAEERVTKLVASTIHLANTYGLSSKELLLYKANLLGANDVQKEAIKIQFERIEAIKAVEDAEKKSLEDDREGKKLQRRKDAAQAELQTILNLNNSELEAIQALEDSRIEKAAASYAQQLISFQEFQTAKTEIELNSAIARQEIEDASAKKAEERKQETLDSIKSVSDSLVDAAASGENLGDVLKNTMRGIATSVIKAGIDILVKNLLTDKIAGAAMLQAKTEEVTSTVAQAGLNAFAATAAIPIVGPALAPAAAAAATGVATGLGAPVIAAAAAREQGGSLQAGQSSTVAERGQLEILTPSSSSRIRTKQQMRQLMGEDGGSSTPVVNVVNIDQTSGGVDIETSTDDDGRIIQLIRNTTSLDAQNPNSELRKSFAASTNLEARR